MDVTTFGGVLALGSSIHQVATGLEDLVDKWVTITDEHKLKVESLKIKIDFYRLEMSRHRIPVDHAMVNNVKKAQEWLGTEEKKVKQLEVSINSGECCAMGWWIYAKLTMITFPQKLENTLKRVTDEIDKVTTNLKVEAEMDAYFRKWKERQAGQFIVHNNDGLYVPIKASQEKVENAIERFPTSPLQRSDLRGRRSDSEQVESAELNFARWAFKKPDFLDRTSDRESDPSWWPRIILLHGGVGLGKSALAYNLCAKYQEVGEKGNYFDHVTLVSCGNCTISEPVKKQLEVLKRLSPNSVEKEEKDPEKIAAALQDFLCSGKKILIILDDVSDGTFLHKMWKAAQLQGGEHVKYLVTSRLSDLCSSLTEDSSVIEMGDPTPDEAMTILATHAGLEGRNIPSELKEIVETMMEATERNPLALACLTTNFRNHQNRGEKRIWQAALRALHKLLNGNTSLLVFGQTHETPWASMRHCIGSLEDDAKAILVLMYACEGKSIPEDVLRLLYSYTKWSSEFFNLRAELTARGLLKYSPSTRALGMDQMEEYKVQESSTLSLGSLVKLYMDWDMAGEAGNEDSTSVIVSKEPSHLKTRLKHVIRDLLGDDAIASRKDAVSGKIKSRSAASTSASKEGEYEIGVDSDEQRVITALCALYFGQKSSRTRLTFESDTPFTDEFVASAARRACTVSKLSGSIDTTNNLRRRKAVEPIIRLLDLLQADDLKWTGPVIGPAREVFLKYVCEGQLDHDNISILLSDFTTTYPQAPLATLTAIAHIFSVQDERSLCSNSDLTFLSDIVRLLELEERVQKSIREAASGALFHIFQRAAEEKNGFEDISWIVAVLVRLMQDSLAKNEGATLEYVDHNPRLLRNAKGALGYAAVGGKSIKRQILGGRQESIQHREPRKAVGGESLERPTSNESVALAGLDSMDQNPILLQNVVGTIMNLAAGADPMKQQILDAEGALGVLVKCLCKDRNARVLENAVGAFMNLALGVEPIKSRILDEDGAVAGLVSSLSNPCSLILQRGAAATLRDLANGSEASISRIANEKGAIGALVESLYKDQNLGLQANTAGALQNLASSNQEQIKLRILGEDGALAGLVKSLSKSRNHVLQEKAAGTLRNLATAGESSKLIILSQEGAVAGLVNCLFVDNNSDLQQNAVEALLNLAGGGESIKLQILEEERALAGLVQSLSKDHNRILQEKAAGALSNLARGGDSIKSKIVNEKYQALTSLVKSLDKDRNPLLQENAAGALLNLAAGRESIKRNILKEDAALLGLVKALCKDHNPGLQENALGALLNLALGEEQSKLKILNVDSPELSTLLLARLKDLSTHRTPIVQEYATGTMNCLANTEGYSNMLNMSENDVLVKEAVERFGCNIKPRRKLGLKSIK